MGNVLSKDEVDALQTALNAGQVTTQKSKDHAQQVARPYDFNCVAGLTTRQKALMEAIHGTLVKILSRTLTAQLDLLVETTLARVEVLLEKEHEATIPFPCTLLTFGMEEYQTRGLLCLHPILGYAVVDRLMGGSGEAEPLERNFSEMEQAAMDEILDSVFSDLQIAWSRFKPVHVQRDKLFANRQLLQFEPEESNVVVVTLEIKIKETTGILTFCYNHQLLELMAQATGETEDNQVAPEDEDRKFTADSLAEVPVELNALMGQVQLSLRELMFLRPGDVLLFDHYTQDPMALEAGGHTRFEGFLGAHGDRMAFAITEKR